NHLSGRFDSETRKKNAIKNLIKDIVEDGWEELEEVFRKQTEVLNVVLKNIGEVCSKILKLRYLHKYSAEEMSAEMNLKSAKVAKDRKYECEKKAKKMAEELLK